MRNITAIRRLFAILVSLSVLFAPAAASAVMAAHQQGMQMVGMGHCDAPPSPADHGKMAGKNCCISMCMAVAVVPSGPAEFRLPRQEIAQSPVLIRYEGTLTEIATPPPRRS